MILLTYRCIYENVLKSAMKCHKAKKNKNKNSGIVKRND